MQIPQVKYQSLKPQTGLYVQSQCVQHNQKYITSKYAHQAVKIEPHQNGPVTAKIDTINYQFRTEKRIGKVGLMMVGIGGNNGTTILGGIIANRDKLSWHTKKGIQHANMLGSMTQASTMKVADSPNGQVFMRLKDIIPLVRPQDLVISGWDFSSLNMAQAMKRAQVFQYQLQKQLQPKLKNIKPLKSIYYPDFIAANQQDRVDNLIEGDQREKHLEAIRRDIQNFKKQNDLNKVIVLWTANTQRLTKLLPGVNDTYENLLKAIKENHPEIAPSTIFALAAVQEGCVFINGSPQNTFVKGLKHSPHPGILIGNDFKTGQTKFKTSFIDFLVNSGIKPKSCVSYNHLGNNDGKNLNSYKQFQSKKCSKEECIKDLLDNSLMFNPAKVEEYPDHAVVIKYIPSAGDCKKAIDEYTSEIFMGGEHTFVSYNVCQDSLLAAGVIIDLVVLSELVTRINYRKKGEDWQCMKGIVSFLGYMTKAPESNGGPIINSLTRQRSCIQNLIRALVGLPLEDNLLLEYRL